MGALASAMLAACGGDGDGDEAPDAGTAADAAPDGQPAADAREGFWLTGTVRAESGTVPATGTLLVLWQVTDDKPRTGLHKRGDLRRSGTTFELPIPVPPAEARITSEVAIAVLMDITADAAVPADGDVDDLELSFDAQGLSFAHAVFHRTGDTGEAWLDAFPLGFSCGRCVQNADDEQHDHYEPAPCSEFEIVTGPLEDHECNFR